MYQNQIRREGINGPSLFVYKFFETGKKINEIQSLSSILLQGTKIYSQETLILKEGG